MNLLQVTAIIEILAKDANYESRRVGQVGKEFELRTQKAHLFKPGEEYPDKITITLPSDRLQAWPAGKYVIDPTSFGAGQYDRFEINGFEFKLISCDQIEEFKQKPSPSSTKAA